MKLNRTFKALSFLAFIVSGICLMGCSNSKVDGISPLEPSFDEHSDLVTTLPDANLDVNYRIPLAIYDAVIDPDAQTFTVTPSRDSSYHFPLTQMYPNSVRVVGYGWTPNFWADIKLSHPLPGSGIDAFDPRIIAILPNNPGVRLSYVFLSCSGNNRVILEPDGYTKLHDGIGGSIPGNVNPFIAYFKDAAYRRWSSMGYTDETKRWQMDINGFGGPMQFKLVVDVSTNYPNPPTPVVDNAKEPVAIYADISAGLNPTGGSAEIFVTVHDWQGTEGIGGVVVECPDLFFGVVILDYLKPGANPNEYVYKGVINNENIAPRGDYKYLVGTWDDATSVYIYKEFTLSVRYNGDWKWTKTWGGTGADEGYSIHVDKYGDVYVAGSFSGTVAFNPAGGGSQTSNGQTDAFVSKFDASGNWIWTKTWGGSQSDSVGEIITDSSGNLYVVGDFQGTVDFNPAGGGTKTSNGYSDAFISKFTSGGTWVWTKTWGGQNYDLAVSLAFDSYQDLYVTGRFYDSVEFNPNGGGLKTSNGQSDAFVNKFDSNGNWKWVNTWGGTTSDTAFSIDFCDYDRFYVTGSFMGSVAFNPEGGGGQLSKGGRDVFLSKFNAKGEWAWSKTWGGTNDESGYSVATDSFENVYVSGEFSGTCQFNPSGGASRTGKGPTDAFLNKLDSSGNWHWVQTWGGGYAMLGYDCARSVIVDNINNVYITGWFSGTNTEFSPNAGGTKTSKGKEDAYLMKYDPDGNWKWVHTWGGTEVDAGYSVTADNLGRLYVAGLYNGTCDFNPEGGGSKTSNGSSDVFFSMFYDY